MSDPQKSNKAERQEALVYRDAEGQPHLTERQESAAAAAQREQQEKQWLPDLWRRAPD